MLLPFPGIRAGAGRPGPKIVKAAIADANLNFQLHFMIRYLAGESMIGAR